MATTSGTERGQSLEKAPFESSMSGMGQRDYNIRFVFPGILEGRWIGIQAARAQTSSYVECQHHKYWPYPTVPQHWSTGDCFHVVLISWRAVMMIQEPGH